MSQKHIEKIVVEDLSQYYPPIYTGVFQETTWKTQA